MSKKAIVPRSMRDLHRDWRMSPGVEVDGFLFLTGFNGMSLDGDLSADSAQQIAVAFDQVFEVLAEAEMGAAEIVEVTSYHIGLRDHLDLFKAEWVRRMVEPYPAWTAIEVAGFASEGVIVELRVIAKRVSGG